MRIILYTGKGGVGKTSIAAATACRLAKEGKKVMIVSTDQAHSLGDSLEIKLSSTTQKVTGGLDALEIDAVKESEDAWGHLQAYMKRVMTVKGGSSIEVEELLVFPGLEELFSLFKILDIYEQAVYDVLIVDCAPTGETMALLKFPEMFGSLIDRILPIKRKAVKVMGPAVEKVTKVPMPEEDVFADLEKLMDKLGRLQTLMLNKDIVSIRIVTTSEKIVIKEAKRNFTCLHLYDYNVDAVIVNKVYPKEAMEGYFNQWMRLQEEGLMELEDSFRDLPLFHLMLQKQELKGREMLQEISDFYGTRNPAEVMAAAKIFQVRTISDATVMEIRLPFAEKEEMDLSQINGELQIAIKNERRCFLLPDALKGLEITAAKFEDGMLRVYFKKS